MKVAAMKAIFGVLSLLIALAIVLSLAKKQLQAVGMVDGGSSIASRSAEAAKQAAAVAADPGDRDGATLAVPGGMPGAVAADQNGITVSQQARNIEQKVRDDAVRAMQQGMQRNERAEH
jgi:hypothetical protein